METGPHMEKQSTDNVPEKKSDLPKSQSDVELGNDVSAETTSKTKNQSQILQHVALLLTILTAITYYFGFFYYESYISYFGLTSDLFPISTEETLIRGVEIYWSLVIKNWIYVIYGVIYFTFVYLFIVFSVSDRALPFTKKIISKVYNSKIFNSPQKIALSDFINNIQKLFLIIFIALSILFLRLYADKVGTDLAKEKQTKFKSDDTPFRKTQLCYLNESNKECIIETYPLLVSKDFQAYFVGSDVLTLPTSRVISVRYVGPKTNEKTAEQ